MMMARCLAVAMVLTDASMATAAELSGCLSQEQRRAAVASRQVMPLVKVIEAAKSHINGEVVGAKLCNHGKELVYVLTVLAHDGKVTKATFDGTSGAVVHAR